MHSRPCKESFSSLVPFFLPAMLKLAGTPLGNHAGGLPAFNLTSPRVQSTAGWMDGRQDFTGRPANNPGFQQTQWEEGFYQ